MCVLQASGNTYNYETLSNFHVAFLVKVKPNTLGNIVAGNKVSGNTQCMVMMGPATMLSLSIQSNIVAGPIMTIFPETLLPATMLPSVCWA